MIAKTLKTEIGSGYSTRTFASNVEIFDSSAEMVEVVKTRKVRFNKDYFKDTDLEYEWHGVGSGAEALQLCEKGWTVKVPEIQKMVREIQKRIPCKKVETFNNVCGFAPIVPLALSGSPLSMLDCHQTVRKTRVIDLVYDMTISCMYHAKDLLDIGMAVLEYVMRLEASGYRVRLSVMTDYTDYDSGDFVLTRIKSETQPFNIERQCFPLFNPAMFRVIGFGWYTTCPTTKSRSGLGRALSYSANDKERNMVFESILGKNACVISAVDLKKHKEDMRGFLESNVGIEA